MQRFFLTGYKCVNLSAHLHTLCCWFSEKSLELAGLPDDVIREATRHASFGYEGYSVVEMHRAQSAQVALVM